MHEGPLVLPDVAPSLSLSLCRLCLTAAAAGKATRVLEREDGERERASEDPGDRT